MKELPWKNIDKWVKSLRPKHVKISYKTPENPPVDHVSYLFNSNEECASEEITSIVEYLSVGLCRPM